MPAVFSFGLDPQEGPGPGRGQGSMAIPQWGNDNKTTMAAGSNRAILPLFVCFLHFLPWMWVCAICGKRPDLTLFLALGVFFNGLGIETEPHQLL